MVKCADCGFLALRNRVSWDLIPADPYYRETAILEPSREYILYPIPLCFAMARNLQIDVESFEPEKTLPQAKILRITQMERECSDFTKWQLGFTPKEHYEMLERQRWQEWQEQQRRSDKQWRIIEIIILSVIVTIIAGGFTVLGAFIERGSLFPPTP